MCWHTNDDILSAKLAAIIMQSPVRRSGSEILVFSELHSDDAYTDYDDGVKKTYSRDTLQYKEHLTWDSGYARCVSQLRPSILHCVHSQTETLHWSPDQDIRTDHCRYHELERSINNGPRHKRALWNTFWRLSTHWLYFITSDTFIAISVRPSLGLKSPILSVSSHNMWIVSDMAARLPTRL